MCILLISHFDLSNYDPHPPSHVCWPIVLPCDTIHVLGVRAVAVGRCPYNSAQHIQNIPFQIYSLLSAILLFIHINQLAF